MLTGEIKSQIVQVWLAIKETYTGVKQDQVVSSNWLGAIVKPYLTEFHKIIDSLKKGYLYFCLINQ